MNYFDMIVTVFYKYTVNLLMRNKFFINFANFRIFANFRQIFAENCEIRINFRNANGENDF